MPSPRLFACLLLGLAPLLRGVDTVPNNFAFQPVDLSGRKVVARCSIGIALFPDNGDTVEALMANADNAMYQAKATRHGSAVFFTEEMNTRLRERMQMEGHA